MEQNRSYITVNDEQMEIVWIKTPITENIVIMLLEPVSGKIQIITMLIPFKMRQDMCVFCKNLPEEILNNLKDYGLIETCNCSLPIAALENETLYSFDLSQIHYAKELENGFPLAQDYVVNYIGFHAEYKSRTGEDFPEDWYEQENCCDVTSFSTDRSHGQDSISVLSSDVVIEPEIRNQMPGKAIRTNYYVEDDFCDLPPAVRPIAKWDTLAQILAKQFY